MAQNAEVAVLYNDLVIQRVVWDDKHTLERVGVLAIAVLHSDEEQRHQSEIGHDLYQLVWTDIDCCLTGHDEDYQFVKLNAPTLENRAWRFPFIMPRNSMEFEGIYVDDIVWQRALAIYADPDGGMF